MRKKLVLPSPFLIQVALLFNLRASSSIFRICIFLASMELILWVQRRKRRNSKRWVHIMIQCIRVLSVGLFSISSPIPLQPFLAPWVLFPKKSLQRRYWFGIFTKYPWPTIWMTLLPTMCGWIWRDIYFCEDQSPFPRKWVCDLKSYLVQSGILASLPIRQLVNHQESI